MPNLPLGEEAKYAAIIQRLKALAAPKQAIVKEQYVETEAGKLVKERGITLDAARLAVLSRQDHVLSDNDQLSFAHLKQQITVAEVCDNGALFDKKLIML